MADQTVRIENMPKSVDGGSPARVAHDLYAHLRGVSQKGGTFAEIAGRHLALYEQCLNAANGHPIDTSKLT